MQGWTVETFPQVHVYHHRRVSTGKGRILSTRFYQGVTNHLLGYHPLFQTMSCIYRVVDPPYVIGSALMLLGYGWSWLRRNKRPLSSEVVEFLRSEQKARMALPFAAWKAVKGNRQATRIAP
jgi:hypothetical protein